MKLDCLAEEEEEDVKEIKDKYAAFREVLTNVLAEKAEANVT